MKRFSICLVLGALVWLGACDPAATGDGSVDTAAFLRLEAGHAWDLGHDIGESGPTPDTLRVFVRSGTADGEDDGASGVSFHFTAGVVDQEPEALLSLRFEADGAGDVLLIEIVDFEGSVSTFDPPPIFGPSAWEPGDSVSSETQLGGQALSFEVTLADRGEHEVYYGLFPDVAHLVVDDGGATVLGGDWWLAEGVGPIRLQTGDYTIPDVELVTYL